MSALYAAWYRLRSVCGALYSNMVDGIVIRKREREREREVCVCVGEGERERAPKVGHVCCSKE